MMTPLEKAIIAVKAGKVEAMESVVKALTNVIPSGQQFEFLKDLLFKLVDAGNIDEIKNYLPEFKSLNLINQADKDGNTVLHHALKTANTELIQLLINNTSPYLPKSINNVGISVEKQINEIKGILLELKDNLFSDVRSGNYASVKGLLPQLKALDLISGTDKSGNTVLHVAALKGNKAMIELLVPHVNPAVKNSTGHTAFLNAIILNHFEAAKLLLEHMPIESVMERHPDLKQNAFHALTLKAGLFHNNQHILELSSKIIEKCKFVDPKLLFIPYFCSESGLMVTPLERIFLTMSVDQTLGDPLTDLTCLIPAGQEFQLFSTLPHEIMDGLNMSIKDCHDSYQQHLFNFIKAGDVKNIKDYLPEFKNLKVINETDTAGNTVLHQAAKGGNLELFELLLKNTSPEVLHKTNIAGENVLEVALNSEHANSNITTILLNLFESNEDLPHILEIDLSGQDGSNNFLDQ
jgi:ankyrin repeat protein